MRSVVRLYPGPPSQPRFRSGAVAQLGEHLLCKQGVTGSIPVSSTRTHSLLPDWRLLGLGRGFNLEAGRFRLSRRFWQVSQPQGWSSSAKEEDLMFDNEIDWVTRLEALLLL